MWTFCPRCKGGGKFKMVNTFQQPQTQVLGSGQGVNSLKNFLNNFSNVDEQVQSGDLLEYEFQVDPNTIGVETLVVEVEDRLRRNGVPMWDNMTRYAVFDEQNNRVLIRYREGSPFTPLVRNILLRVLSIVAILVIVTWIFRKVLVETGQTIEETLPQLAVGGILVAGALFLLPNIFRTQGSDTS